LIRDFRRSGLTAQEFADRCGVCVQTVYRWLREEEPVSQPLVPVQITTSVVRDPIRFVHSNGWQVELPASMAQEPLLKLLTALAAYSAFVLDPGWKRLGCTAHSRRKLHEALKDDPQRAKWFLLQMTEHHEHECRHEGREHEHLHSHDDHHDTATLGTIRLASLTATPIGTRPCLLHSHPH